jgi:hypothetical protein
MGGVLRDLRIWRFSYSHQALDVDYGASTDGGRSVVHRERGLEETLHERSRCPLAGSCSGILSRHAEFGGSVRGGSVIDEEVIKNSCAVNVIIPDISEVSADF